jgi:hypothetical protein
VLEPFLDATSIVELGFKIIPDSLSEARATLGIKNAIYIDTRAARASPFMGNLSCKLAPSLRLMMC